MMSLPPTNFSGPTGPKQNDPLADVPVGESLGMAMGDVAISTQKLAGRQRRIRASIQIPFELKQVWQVITDYDRLADFIPNLTQSQRLPHPAGGIRLEQVGSQCFLNIKFCARVVLDMVERFPQELGFSMVEGDFRQFEGVWRLEPIANGSGTQLIYDLLVLPPRVMPPA